MLLDVGDSFGDVIVERRLGLGLESAVYLVRDPRDGALRALKVLRQQWPAPSDVRDLFTREFQIADSLRHPNIVRVFDHGEHDGRLWLTMQYIGGGTGAQLVPSRRQAPALLRVLDALEDIGSALDHAHANGVLHRDVKPSNILLKPDGLAVLSDFGIAQLLDDTRPIARNGRIKGSLPYAAPELLQGQPIGPPVDVYALACTLTEMLTGLPPYPRATGIGIVSAHLTAAPPRLSARRSWLPGALDDVVARALAKEPDDRPASCVSFMAEVADLLERARPRTPRGYSRRLPRLRLHDHL